MTPDELQELCALYVLGTLEPQEAAALEARLQAGDPDVVRTVAAFREVAELLPYALSPVSPSPAVRARLLDRVQSTLPARQARQEAARRRGAPRWFRTSLVWLPTAVAAGLVLIFGWVISDLRLQVTALETRLQQLRGVAADHERLLAFLTLPEVKIVALAGTPHAPNAGARLLWDTTRGEWTVILHDLPPLPPGKVYQLWLLTAGSPIPSGTFQPDLQSRGVIQAQLPHGRADIAGAAVSLEPEGGVPQPTGQIILAGKF